MGFFRFYGLVLREAFRHSLDIAQAIIFVLLGFSGFIAARNPGLKPMLESLNLGGWQIAAMVFGSIIAIRLILAPYWLWKGAQSRIVSGPQNSVDYQLRVSGIGNRNDKKRKIIQVFFQLRNALPIPLQYEVEDVDVMVAGDRNDNPRFQSMGGIVPAQAINTFDFAPITLTSAAWIKPGTEGTASITYKYGIAGQSFARRAKFICKIIIDKHSTRHLTIEDSEENV